MDPSWHHHHHHHHHHHRPSPPLPPGGAPPPPPPPPPPLHGTICPVCSIYHFPFCPPPIPQNYPSSHPHQHPLPHPDQFYPRPPQHPPPPIPPPTAYDPFVDHLGVPVVGPHRPFLDSQRPPWSSNPGLHKDPHGVPYANNNDGNVGAKRMRFDDSGFSSSPAGAYANEHFVNPYADNERRLKLIREHGGAIFDEFDRNSGAKRNFDELSDAGYEPKIGSLTQSSLNTDFDRKGNFLVQERNAQKNEEGIFGQSYNVGYGVMRDNRLDYSLRQSNIHQHSVVYNDRMSGFDRELHSPDNHFVKKSATQHVREQKPNQYGLPYLNSQQPPLPISPPPPLPLESPGHYLSEPVYSSSLSVSSTSLFPILPSSSAAGASPYPPVPEYHHSNKGHLYVSSGYAPEQAPYKAHFAGSEVIAQRPLSPDKPQVIDASHIIKHPYRATRPDHIVIILRGLPGSGKSYLAKMLRDLEVENGGNIPRIHSMDDYFMTEVDKVEEIEVPKTSATVRGKKAVTKKVMEYSYEPEMEEAYRSSMLKAFKKTLDDWVFNFVIVDDRNLRVADFAQFWATAKRAGYEVYLLEASYKDPAGCAARNVHGFLLDDIQKMADLWEQAPSLYLKLDIKSLLHGDCLEDNGIQEVEMDMEDEDAVGTNTQENNVEKLVVPPARGLVSNEKDENWEAETDHPPEEVKELGKSKWSNDLDEDDIRKSEANGNLIAVSGLLRSHNKEGKSVRWGDQIHNSGFSIAAAKTVTVASLVIGPGAGYNMKSNPFSDEEKITSSSSSSSRKTGVSRKQNVFQEQLRAERESFKAVFDKRRQRISGLGGED